MGKDKDAMAGEPASPEVAAEQQKAVDWPKPGEEGYVHPDGTPQSVRQLEENRRAAADRAAAGSVVHGAPLANPGQDPQVSRAVAEKRAEAYSGPSTEDAEKALTESVREGLEATPAEATPPTKRTTTPAKKTTR